MVHASPKTQEGLGNGEMPKRAARSVPTSFISTVNTVKE